MKKLLVSLLLVVMLLPATSLAMTAELDGFTFELPDGFSASSSSDSYYHFYESESHSDPTIKVTLFDYAYSLEDVVDTYSAEIININGIDMAQWNERDSLNAVFLAGQYFYQISCETLGSYDPEDEQLFDTVLQSIIITADTGVDEETMTAAQAYTTLEKGSKGEEVKVLQQRLIDLLFLSGNADGDYGNKTKAAVEEFQKAAGILPATGIADGITQAKLFADDAPEAELSVSCSVAGINNYYTAYWNVNGQEFTLKGNQTKTLDTPWGKYKFDASGEYEKID